MRLSAAAVATLLTILAILHHDFWWWNDASLVLDWIPVGLAWHVFYAFLASAVWAVIVSSTGPQDSPGDTP
jgi:hypothetical protein